MRNPLFVWQLALLAAVQAALGAACGVLAGTSAALAVAVSASASCVLFSAFSAFRYREIAHLTSEIDQVLHTARRIDLTECREGDVAVLRNEVAKMTARLCRGAEALGREKAALADALADISHQIRTPLTAIELMIPAIERAGDGETRARKLHELGNMLDRVSWLVTALLKLARLDAGAVRLECQPVDAGTVLRSATAPLAIALDVRGIACYIEAPGGVVFEGDADWTAEAIENIAKNCMEHTPAGGSISLRAVQDAVAVRIFVSDTGPGISDEDMPHIFERFYRGSGSGGSEGDGSGTDTPSARVSPQGFGIGLSLARALAVAQGGTLRASNLQAGGACFEMIFPKVVV